MITVLIVENEATAAAALKALLQKIGGVQIISTCADVASAKQQIVTNRPQIIFLDVELDGESGFELLESFTIPSFEIIFTTAYSSYALRAIKHACLDYLLKPIALDELKLAIGKFSQKKDTSYKNQVQLLLESIKYPQQKTRICLPVSGGYEFVNLSDIIMCRAEANYSVIFPKTGEKIVCSRNLGSLEETIDDTNFFRCHKSYLINIHHIKKFWQRESPHVVLENNLEAEVSLRKKDQLLDLLRTAIPIVKASLQ